MGFVCQLEASYSHLIQYSSTSSHEWGQTRLPGLPWPACKQPQPTEGKCDFQTVKHTAHFDLLWIHQLIVLQSCDWRKDLGGKKILPTYLPKLDTGLLIVHLCQATNTEITYQQKRRKDIGTTYEFWTFVISKEHPQQYFSHWKQQKSSQRIPPCTLTPGCQLAKV